MIHTDHARFTRVTLVAGIVAAAGFALSGCVASPTYGTHKTANQQLLEDVTGMLALGPKKGPQIDYKPRPTLVTPETTAVLPPPQDDVTTASSTAWPESPEERLARVRAEADENRDSPFFRPNVIDDVTGRNTEVTYNDPILSNMSSRERHEELKRRRVLQAQGDPNNRKFLSEPPVEYRQPAETAPVGDVGESEWKKDRRARRNSPVDERANPTSRPSGTTLF